MTIENSIKISLKDGAAFTSFRFYNELLPEIANYYRSSEYKGQPPVIVLDRDLIIEPSTLPLIITLGAHLKQFHRRSLVLELENDLGSNGIIKFLQKSDFLNLVGDNVNPNFPIGRRIFEFDKRQVGDFKNKNEQRTDHKVRIYSLNDSGVMNVNLIEGEEAKRDFLIEYFTFLVAKHFEDLLNDIKASEVIKGQFVNILSELITNGLYHSGSDTYVMMFSNRYKTTCSISDNGIGLFNTISTKPANEYYTPLSVFSELKYKVKLKMSEAIQKCAFSIFETFYFSMLKNRQGLFDLMLNVVINCKGYFRLHYDSVQIIVSGRMLPELNQLSKIRSEITIAHNKLNFGLLPKDEFLKLMILLTTQAKEAVISLALSIFQKYSQDVQFSAIRIFNIKFKGVHIETEIPQEIIN